MKVPIITETDHTEFVARFYREAKAAAKLRHPNICPVFDVGEIDDIHFSTMAYIQGRPLADFIVAGKPLPIPLVLGHGAIAVTGYVLLLVSYFGLA